ncbi:glycosyltransferase family 2 protein [Leuconostoc lactis]|uniref:glycosyltransferase family 2 protein n=1 Tax=Leuconostoc lactis TaxID=1246 RepID=UPI0024ACFDC5|nr:glycosyltransferase family 2 protein [Leuconostoc lactis]MDI6572590.1 glycosyltransferase family 2 protein [Leuconostoc lactis]
MNNNGLVSVIMPNYNTGEYVIDAINSVLRQTYSDIELIVVDDKSNDDSVSSIKEMANLDERIKLVLLDENQGAANARNIGIQQARGKYLAFIDSDDIWIQTKLEKQLKYMSDNNIAFLASYYDYVDFQNNSLNKVIKGPLERDYFEVLRNCPGNSTVIYNTEMLGKTTIPLIRRRNDYVMWLKVIKKAKMLYVMPEILVHYRIRPNSLSSKKTGLVKYHWYIYRKIEKLNFFISLYLIFYLVGRGVGRKIWG